MRPLPLLLAVLVTAAINIAATTTVRAGAWCIWYDWSTYNCGFRTYQQCLETMRGDTGSYCAPNAYDDTPPPRPEPRKHRRQSTSR